jgi:hypothetical protein
VIRLPPTLANPTSNADFFTPQNWSALDQADLDLGGTSPFPIDVPVSPVVQRVLAWARMATPTCSTARISAGSAAGSR